MKKPKKEAAAQLSFETAQEKLEEIVDQLEHGQLSLDAGLAGYEEGIRLLRQCYSQLDTAQRKVELLSGVDADGNPITESFDDEMGDNLTEKSKSRSGRRSAKKSE